MELGLEAPTVIGHSLGASVAAVHAIAHDARATVCVDVSLRFGDFASVVQARAADLRGDNWADALLDLVEPARFAARVIAFSER